MGLDRDLRYIFLSILLFSLSLGLYNNIWPAYVRNLGADPVALGLLGSVGWIIATAAALPGGYVADHFDRRLVMLMTWLMAVPVPLLFVWARSWQGLLPGVALMNLSMAGNAALQAYIVDRSRPQTLGYTFSVVFASFPLGMTVSPVIGGWLSERYGMAPVFYLSAILYLASALAILPIASQHPSPHHAEERRDGSLWQTPFVAALVLAFSINLVQWVWQPFVTPYLQDVVGLDLFGIGVLGSTSAAGAVALSAVFGRVSKRIGTYRGLLLSIAVMLVALGLTLACLSLPGQTLAAFLRGSNSAIASLLGALVGATLTGAWRGRGYAFFNLAIGLAATAGPYAAGWLYRASPAVPFWVSIAGLALLLPMIEMAGRLAQPTRR